jgi:amino acid transporter
MNLRETLRVHLDKGVVGFPTALASSVGVILASPVILTVTTGFGLGGGTFAIAMAIALIMMLAQSTTFAEAMSILPTSGSVYDYVSCGLGRFAAITGTVAAYFLVHVFAGTAETILSGIMATVNFDAIQNVLDRTGTAWLVGVGLVITFGIVNFLGITVFSKAEIVLTAFMWSTLMIFSLTGVLSAPLVQLDGLYGRAPTADLSTIVPFIGMAMFMFVGCELVTPMAPEMKNASRNIPRGMAIGLCLVALLMYTYGAALCRQVVNVVVNPGGTVRILETPQAIPAFARQVMGPLGKIWIGIGFLFAGAATLNTLMAALPRILYGMALDGALPRAFAYLHPRFKTPVVGILVAVAVPCVHAWYLKGNLNKIMNLVLAAVCSWGIAYLLVTLSVVRLRVRRPDIPRAYRSPFFPIPQIVSSVGIVLGIWYITPPGLNSRDIYAPFLWMLGIVAAYALVWSIFVMKINPFKPVPVENILAEEFKEDGVAGAESDPAHGHEADSRDAECPEKAV